MNKVILMGRLVRDPETRYTNGTEPMCVTRYTIAIDRRMKKEGKQSADFINCVAFGKTGEHAEKFYHQGIKVVVTGRIQTGSYTNKEGRKVYTTDVVVEEQEFAESKTNSQGNGQQEQPTQYPADEQGFMNIPDGIDEELPFD